MTAQRLPSPNFNNAFVDGRGFLTRWAQAWISSADSRLGGRQDKVDAVAVTASAATPQSTQVVAGGGLQLGGTLNGNVAVALYHSVDLAAKLPTLGNAEGDWCYALDARKLAETTGNGSGMPVFWSTPLGVGGWFTPSGLLVTT
jgi:hypothetical protein